MEVLESNYHKIHLKRKKNTKNKKRRGTAITWETAKTFYEDREEKRIAKELKKKLNKEQSKIELSCILKYTDTKCVINVKKSIWEKILEGGYYEKVNLFYNNEKTYKSKWIFKD